MDVGKGVVERERPVLVAVVGHVVTDERLQEEGPWVGTEIGTC